MARAVGSFSRVKTSPGNPDSVKTLSTPTFATRPFYTQLHGNPKSSSSGFVTKHLSCRLLVVALRTNSQIIPVRGKSQF